MNTTEPPTLDALAIPLETYVGQSYRWTSHPRTPVLRVAELKGVGALTDVILADSNGEFRRQIPATMFRSELALRSLQPIDESAPTNTAPDVEKHAPATQEHALPGQDEQVIIPQTDGALLGRVEGSGELPLTLAEEILGLEICATDADFNRATAIPALSNFPEVAALLEPEAPSVIPAWAAERWGADLLDLTGQALEVRYQGVLRAMVVEQTSDEDQEIVLVLTNGTKTRDRLAFETFFAKIDRGDILVHAEKPGRDPVTDATIEEIRAVGEPRRKPRKATEPTDPTPLPSGLDALRAEEANLTSQIDALYARREEVYSLISDEETRAEEEAKGVKRQELEVLLARVAELRAEMGVSA